jgi:hypothetical protein
MVDCTCKRYGLSYLFVRRDVGIKIDIHKKNLSASRVTHDDGTAS